MFEFPVLVLLLTATITYLLGAVPFGLITTKLFGIDDIRQHGSGNIGAANVWRIAGAKVALLVFIGDIGKGVLAVLFAEYIYGKYTMTGMQMELFFALCGMMAVIGHMFPIYLGFKGGKGVNTGLGVVVTLLPVQTLISLGAFILTLFISRYVSLGSMVAASTLFVVLLIQKYGINQPVSSIYIIMSLFLSLLVIVAHRKNISRIISGTENRFKLSTNSSDAR